MPGIFSVSLGVLLALAFAVLVIYFYLKDITQKKHSILRNYPLVGRLRYFFEQLGEYFRQYFFLGDRDERPFDRSTRTWVYRMAKNEGGVLGFLPGVVGLIQATDHQAEGLRGLARACTLVERLIILLF